MTPDEVLDPQTVAYLREAGEACGSDTFIHQLVEIFSTNAPGRLTQMAAALAAHDGKTLGRIAHTLKSNCSMLGATALAATCAALEECGDANDFARAADVLADANQQFPAVLAAVTALTAK